MNPKSNLERLLAHRLVCAALFGSLATIASPMLAMAQDGGPEGDVVAPEEAEEVFNQEDPNVANERDALSNRPTVTITRPDVPTTDEPGKKKKGLSSEHLTVQLDALTKMTARDNLDFRQRVESSQLDVYDTDDRLTYGANQARLGLIYQPVSEASFNVGLGHNGLWGGDSLRNLNNSNTLFIDSLFFVWQPIDMEGFGLTFRTGRQYFEIGGAGDFGGARRDYLFWDVVDGVTMDLDFRKAGKLRVLGLDVVGLQYRPDEIDFVTRGETGSADLNFRGDTSTYRFGGVYELTDIAGGLEARAFGFYADIGAGDWGTTTGADRCYGGGLCNSPDNDFNWMAGGRIGYFIDDEDKPFNFGVYGEFARSGGVDRKATEIGVRDVTANGNAFGGGLNGAVNLGSITLDGGFQFFRADGGAHVSENGMLFNYGFVGFKGAHVGGVAMDDNAGWHPSAYVGSSVGVEHMPQDQRRKAGTQSIFAGFGLGVVDTLKLDFGFWNLRDTGLTFVDDFDAVSQNPPFGYGPNDIYAQRRLGKSLGNEIDFGLTYLASNTISVFAQGGVFMPGEFYEIEVLRGAGGDITALGSEDPRNFWVVTGGLNLRLR